MIAECDTERSDCAESFEVELEGIKLIGAPSIQAAKIEGGPDLTIEGDDLIKLENIEINSEWKIIINYN